MKGTYPVVGAGLHADIGGAVHAKITERERAVANQGGRCKHAFNIDVFGIGEVDDVRCTFGYAFVAQPDITSGISLHDGDSIVGPLPRARVAVHRWIRNDAGLYLAAHVAVTTFGHRRQRARVSVVFSGIGITLPLGPSTDSGGGGGGFSFSDPLP